MSGRPDASRPAPGTPRRPPRPRLARGVAARIFFLVLCLCAAAAAPTANASPPQKSEPTPLQREIETQRARLSSASQEERRDAVTRLGAMARPEGSRAAAAALGDSSAVVRATAARAVLSLAPGEAATLLVPLLRDRDEFVRRETAYALGLARSTVGVSALSAALETDKEASVRGAAAGALGRIGDASAAPALIGAISRRLPAPGFFNRLRRRRIEEDEFVRRASATALGLLGSREGVPVLIAALSNERTPDDVRREAAQSLGLIGDPSAIPALRAVLAARDPYLSRIAFEALRRLDPANSTRPT
jgi:HEAT repeat protein